MSAMAKSYVVALEGIPGSGKTTLRKTISVDGFSIDRVVQILPGDPDTDTDLGLNQIIESDKLKTLRAMARRYDIVILDRYYLSTLAYQFSYDIVSNSNTYKRLAEKYEQYLADGKLMAPDITFYIDTLLRESYLRKNRLSGDEMWVNDRFLELNRMYYSNQEGLYTIDGRRSLTGIQLEIERVIKKGVSNERSGN